MMYTHYQLKPIRDALISKSADILMIGISAIQTTKCRYQLTINCINGEGFTTFHPEYHSLFIVSKIVPVVYHIAQNAGSRKHWGIDLNLPKITFQSFIRNNSLM